MPVTLNRKATVKRFPSGDPFAVEESPRSRLMRGVAAQLRLAAAMNPPGALQGTVSVSAAQLVSADLARAVLEQVRGGAA